MRRLYYPSGQKYGFTMLELMVVLMIIAILVLISMPIYTRAVEKAKGDGAIANLRLILTGEKMYRLDYGIFARTLDSLSAYVENPEPGDQYFSYSDPSAPDGSFTVTATRDSGSATYKGKTIILRYDATTNAESWSGSWDWLP